MSEPTQIPERIHLRVLSTEQELFDEHILWVQIPLEDGLIGIWPGHAPLVAVVNKGMIHFGREGGEEEMGIESGILRVEPERCTILASGWKENNGKIFRTNIGDLEDRLEQGVLDSLSQKELQELQEPANADSD